MTSPHHPTATPQAAPPDAAATADAEPPPTERPQEPVDGRAQAPSDGQAATGLPGANEQVAPPLDWNPVATTGVCVASLIGAAFLATLAASLVRAVPANIGKSTGDADHQAALARHLERTETLGAAASLGAHALRVAAAVTFFGVLLTGTDLGPLAAAAISVALGGPVLYLLTQSLPVAFARTRGSALVNATLPTFAWLSRPLIPIVALLRGLQRAVLRAARTPDSDDGTRRLVEGFRAMVEGEDFDGDLGADTRELIANVIEFGEADAAEVMTPRTEIRAISEDAKLVDAVRIFAKAGYSRIPVFEGTIDTIIGTLTALEAAKAVADGRLDATRIRDVMRPPLLVPETVPIPKLLAQFRAERQKMAIVVDEYGGTAGLVTLADVIAEIVGHIKDEYEVERLDFRVIEGGTIEANAGLHVSEVNEELDLEIPEESDYETLAGFVLSELGRFPAAGESFTVGDVTFRVTEASDRRIHRVAIDRAGGLSLSSARAGEVNARAGETNGAEGAPGSAPHAAASRDDIGAARHQRRGESDTRRPA